MLSDQSNRTEVNAADSVVKDYYEVDPGSVQVFGKVSLTSVFLL